MFPSRLASVLGGGAGLPNNYSLDFDGTDDYINVGNTSNFVTAGQARTVSLWTKLLNGSASNDYYITLGNMTGTRTWFALRQNTDYLVFSDNETNTNLTTTNANMLDSWKHVALTYDGSTTVKVYVDGSLDTSITTGGTLATDQGADVIIGARNSSSSADGTTVGQYINANIDEVAIWNTALSAGDISALYQAKGTSDLNDDGNSANLQGWWRMGDGTLDDFNLIADQVNPTLGSDVLSGIGDFSSWGGSGNDTIPTGWAQDGTASETNRFIESSGALRFLCDGNTLNLKKESALTVGTTYKITLDVTAYSSGDVKSSGSGGDNWGIDATGSYTQYFTASSTTFYIQRISSSDITIDNLIVKPVNGNPGIMTSMAAEDIVTDTP